METTDTERASLPASPGPAEWRENAKRRIGWTKLDGCKWRSPEGEIYYEFVRGFPPPADRWNSAEHCTRRNSQNMNLTKYRARSGYGLKKKWSVNAHLAKERKRLERGDAIPAESPAPPRLPKRPGPKIKMTLMLVDDAGKSETISATIVRFDRKFLFRGKLQAASSIGKRIATVIENILA